MTRHEHARIDWPQLLSFVEEHRPGWRATLRGAAPADLRALDTRSPKPLPVNYVEFLRHFGAHDGGYPVFPAHRYLARDLLGAPPPRWDPAHYLLIGLMKDTNSEAPFDLLLDLADTPDPSDDSNARSIDAPLVGLPPAHDENDEAPDDDDDPNPLPDLLAPSLADRLIRNLAWDAAIRDKPLKGRLVSFCAPSPHRSATRIRQAELVHAIANLGYDPCVSTTPNTWLGRRAETLVTVYTAPTNNLVMVEARATAPAALTELTDELQRQNLADPIRIIGD
ncbi:hypothetical protein [Herbiconiux daphne]|uniref:Uncharacterized protein n=1 Tax=Herbiconiux daphne TaxID=2970914 RepID=A0ABT2H1I5_9MICO|nr:hypothetical protein [Herbiconiux daphne]MCS5733808.1 hypothetical protein [Herbiconiux daphne]